MPMAAHVDVLEQQDSLRRPTLISISVHVALFSALWISANSTGTEFGSPNPGGGLNGVVGIQVASIPLQSRSGPRNPLANDTPSLVPAAPKSQLKRVERAPDPDAISLHGRTKPEPRKQLYETAQGYRTQPDRPNQLYSSTGQALVSPMNGAPPGAPGIVGVGPRTGFGSRFGAYSALLQQRVAQKWRTEDVDRSYGSPVVVTFDLLRNGQIRNLRVLQSSGNRGLDYSSQRAITEAAPFPELPREYERDSAQVEFVFRLK